MKCCEDQEKWGKRIDSLFFIAWNRGMSFDGMPAWRFCPFCGTNIHDTQPDNEKDGKSI